MGRPKEAVKRNEQMHLRCTLLEKKAIQQQARNAGLSDAEYLRNAALKRSISYKLTEDEVTVYKMLAKYRHHFKLIGNLIKERKPFSDEVKGIISELDRHLKKLL